MALNEKLRERIEQREQEIQTWEQLPLPEQQRSPHEQVPAVAVVVEMDGGRLQIRERKPSAQEEKHGSYWREMKVGCLLTVASGVFEEDPCPTLPQVFVHRRRMRDIVREIKGFCVAEDEESLHGEVGDGQEANWTVHRTRFSHYVPILDFIHGLCYVFAGALAGRRLREGWPVYRQWAQWVWSGQVERVIEALQIRQQELGLPEADESEESPRQKVADALRYLQKQKPRMRYNEYRRQGLPLTTFWRERPNRATGQRHYQSAS